MIHAIAARLCFGLALRCLLPFLQPLCCAVAFGLPPSEGGGSIVPLSLREDAVIRAVQFVNPRAGWAVGESGTIWHTKDGGLHWQLQDVPVGCHLLAVSFLDSQTGWAAGGWIEPYTHLSRGVLLRTDDGGKHWSVWSKDPLPQFRQIQFFDSQQGIAITAASPLYPQGLLFTEDGGRSWATVPGDLVTSWQCGAFQDARNGFVAGSTQRAILRAGALRSLPLQQPSGGAVAWQCVCIDRNGLGYALDYAGRLHLSRDGGHHWEQRSTVPLPPTLTPRTIEAKGRHVWIAGSPGHQIFSSSDGGNSWSRQSTGQSLPLWDLHFLNSQTGWAVGEFGTILMTENGGSDWKVQHKARQRAAVLGVFATADSVPLEIFLRLSAAEGYTSSVALLGHSPICPSVPLDAPTQRQREALLSASVNAVDQSFGLTLPVGFSQLSIEAFETSPLCRAVLDRKGQGPWNAHHVLKAFEDHLETQIRLYRPDLILTHPATHRAASPLGFAINQAVLRAIERAAGKQANRSADPELTDWQVRKVYGLLPPRTSGSLSLSTRQWMVGLEGSLTECAQPARGLLNAFPEAGEDVLHFSLLLNKLPQDRGGGDFFSGLHLAPGGEARRPLAENRSLDPASVKRIASRADVLRAVLASAGAGQPSLAAWRAQIHRAAAELSADQAGRVLVDVAAENIARGKAPLAAETLALLIDHCPDHPLTGAAWKWLLTFHASGECRYRFGQLESDRVHLATAAREKPGEVKAAVRATEWAARLQQRAPVLFADPRIQLPLMAAYRDEGQDRKAERLALATARAAWFGPYAECSTTEINASPHAATRPRWIADRAASKPYLDGRMDDPCWQEQKANMITLRDRVAASKLSTQVQTCFDAQYLYFGLRCEKAAGIFYGPPPAARRRDAAVEAHDRVQILIDTDRDYATSYRLTVDARGCTHDQMWMDATWNPDWYVARGEDATHWTCEIAIPLTTFSDAPRTQAQLWACGVQRIIPGRGLQSWTSPASIEIDPSGFGHLQLPHAID